MRFFSFLVLIYQFSYYWWHVKIIIRWWKSKLHSSPYFANALHMVSVVCELSGEMWSCIHLLWLHECLGFIKFVIVLWMVIFFLMRKAFIALLVCLSDLLCFLFCDFSFWKKAVTFVLIIATVGVCSFVFLAIDSTSSFWGYNGVQYSHGIYVSPNLLHSSQYCNSPRMFGCLSLSVWVTG